MNAPFIVVAVAGGIGLLVFAIQALIWAIREWKNPTRTMGTLFLGGYFLVAFIFVCVLGLFTLIK